MTDYCDTCKYMKEEMQRCTATIQRIRDGGNVVREQLQGLEDNKSKISQQLAEHKEGAPKAREFFHKMTDRCKTDWQTINNHHTREAQEEFCVGVEL